MVIKNRSERFRHWMYIIGLMIAGESIYLLPYMRKTFQTSMEVVFGLTALQVGWLNTTFGILAFISYFPSGWLADRISARRLLTFSLIATGFGGLLMITIPSYPGLFIIHAFWGITSILTFWAALIKATRNWGNPQNQGMSFGLLDGGRGLVAAILASIATLAYATGNTTENSLKSVILIYSLAPIATGVLIWFVIPDKQYINSTQDDKKSSSHIKRTIRKRQVWLLSLVIFCAYLLYVGSFDFPAFAERVYEQTKTFGAVLGTIRDWMRPIAAIGAGFIADRFSTTKTIKACFLLLAGAFLSMSIIPASTHQLWLLWIQVIITALAVFSLRGIYFAMLEETGIPMTLTGTTVGIVSFIGFIPDIFAHALSGWFVAYFPDNKGYQYYYFLLAMVALIGFLVTFNIRKFKAK